MYEYTPKLKKVKEKLLLAGFLLVAVACYCVSSIPNIPLKAIYQFFMVLAFSCAVLIIARCLMRSFSYAVLPQEDKPEALPDFTVTETYGRKATVVCRISVGDLRRVIPVSPENKKEISAMQKRKNVYYYTGRIAPGDFCLLVAEENGEEIFIQICADERLMQLLNSYAEQYLSEI